MNKSTQAKDEMKSIVIPIVFYITFLMSVYILMNLSLLPFDFVFLRFHLLSTVVLGFFLWACRDRKHAAFASVSGVIVPIAIMACWFLLKAFVLFQSIEWTADDFRAAIAFSALFGVVCPMIFFDSKNLRSQKMINASQHITVDKQGFIAMKILKIIIMVLLSVGMFISILFWSYALDLFQPFNVLVGLPVSSRKIDIAVSAITSITVSYILVNLKWNKPS